MEFMIRNFKVVPNDPLEVPMTKGLVYEVVRVIEHTPLFFKEHYDRLINTLESSGADFDLSYEKYREATDELIATSKEGNFNLKTIIDPERKDIYIFESPSSYPEDKLYRKGIDTVILKYERSNPNAKIVNTDLNALARQVMEATKSYEVLLEDSEGNITEGSRSNIFFFKEGKLYTSPVGEVLPGITRMKIMETMKNLGIEVIEKEIHKSTLGEYEGAFMSGTSPKILPIRSIDELSYEVPGNEFIVKLINGFNATIEKDLKEYRA